MLQRPQEALRLSALRKCSLSRLAVFLLLSALLSGCSCSPGYYPDREADIDDVIEMEPLEVNAGLYIDSERFEDDYLGLIIRVPGAISRISEASGGARVVELGNHGITKDGEPGHVVCELKADPQVSGLAAGDRVTVEGEYAESLLGSDLQIRLSDCELVP